MAQLLLRRGAEVNHSSPGGITPLHLAARYSKTTLVEALLERGADRMGPDSRLGVGSFHDHSLGLRRSPAEIIEDRVFGGVDEPLCCFQAVEFHDH